MAGSEGATETMEYVAEGKEGEGGRENGERGEQSEWEREGAIREGRSRRLR
jgi:hypothetical protein